MLIVTTALLLKACSDYKHYFAVIRRFSDHSARLNSYRCSGAMSVSSAHTTVPHSALALKNSGRFFRLA